METLMHPFDGRGTGFVPGKPRATARVGAINAPIRFAEPDLRSLRGPRLYQGSANACTAFDLTRRLYIAHAIAGILVPLIASPAFLYYNARAIAYSGLDPRLTAVRDDGAIPELVMDALRTFGFCRFADAPYDPATVNARPSRKAYRKAYDQRATETYGIFEEGQDRIDAIADCLRKGLPVGLAMLVDKPFMEHRGNDAVTRINPRFATGHMVTPLWVERDGTVGFDNWWADHGANDGTFRLAPDVVRDSEIILYVSALRAVPSYSDFA